MSIPFIDLKTQYAQLKEQIDTRIQDVLNHGQYILGPEVKECETALSEFTGSKHTVSCANGTDALVLGLMALEVGAGDEVIVPGFSFIATAETVVLVGAKPVFVDIEEDTYNIDASKIEAAITPNTKAIVAVGLFGQPADWDAINAIAEKHNLAVIDDGAQSFGSKYKDKSTGNLTQISTTSFFPAKPLGCYGDGGAIFTNDDSIHEALVSMRMHGMALGERYKHVRIGTNARMDTLQCAILLPKLEKFPWELEQRAIVADRYSEKLKDLNLKLPTIREGRTSAYAQFTVWVDDRDGLRNHLNEKKVPSAVHYPIPMYRQPAYEKYHNFGPLDHCEYAAKGVVSLPMHPYLDEGTQDQIVAAIREFLS